MQEAEPAPVAEPARPVVEAVGLTKKYRDLVAVDGIDFAIQSSECFGFLGPNGAGKTTTMKMIYGRLPLTSGQLTVLGKDIAAEARVVKTRVGVVPQEDNLDPDLSVMENLLVYGRYFDLPRRETRRRAVELLDFVQLAEKADVNVEKLSGGMKRRLVIARALINGPELVILDEPTTGLDPQARHMVWQKLRALKAEGVTLILTTHYMEEATWLCDRLVIMDEGRILAEGEPQALIAEHAGREVLELRVAEPEHQRILQGLRGQFAFHEKVGDLLFLYGQDGERLLHKVRQLSVPVESSLLRRATLEDVFLKLTGRALQE
ncbi:MAG: ABC transporter ATP-binding protein [Syntrophothermus sp.]